MEHVLPVTALILVTVTAFAWDSRSFSRRESLLLAASLCSHIAAAFAQVWITRYLYGGGDMFNYYSYGLLGADALRTDFAGAGVGLLRLVAQQDSGLSFYMFGAGSSTGTMSGITAFLLYLFDDSLYAACIAVAVVSYWGKLALYRSLRARFATHLQMRLLVASTLVPSVVFWSSGILKESIAVAALGWMFWALQMLLIRRTARHVLVLAAATVVVALTKAYILFAFVVATGAWLYFRRFAGATERRTRLQPFFLAVGSAVAVGGVVLLGWLFPEYAVENLGSEVARYQELGAVVRGGSYYEIGDATERGLLGQLTFAPIALLSALFRPLIFEASNVQMAVNAIETTFLFAALSRTLYLRSGRWILRSLAGSPTLLFCLVFVITFGVAVGLATTNAGTLSRYRMPLVPFFAALVMVWTAPLPRSIPDATRPTSVRPDRSGRARG